MGKGKDLFGKYNDLGKEKGPGTAEYDYSCILFQALLMVGERKVFELLEEAEVTGQKLSFAYITDPESGNKIPNNVLLETAD